MISLHALSGLKVESLQWIACICFVLENDFTPTGTWKSDYEDLAMCLLNGRRRRKRSRELRWTSTCSKTGTTQSVGGCGMLSQVLILACLWLIKHAGCLKLAWHSQLAVGSELACNSQLVGGSELACKSQLTGSFELACKSQLTGGFELACQSQLTGGFELASKSQLVGGSKRVIMRTWWACL